MQDLKQLLIPTKIKVGFQEREGTYTGKLAYVIYYDQKGVLRKEKSWESWRDEKIDSLEFNNEPMTGFVLNKGVGGQRHSDGWNARNEYIRVYDPRDFEFEISVANLLFILRECDCSKGKGLEGKFVYAWDGTELVLLPECSVDYKNSQSFTQLQTQSVKFKDLILGASYTTKRQETLTYLGKFDYHIIVDNHYRDAPIKERNGVVKKLLFWNGEEFVFLDNLKTIAALSSDAVIPEYAELVDAYNKSEYGSKIAKLFLKPGSLPEFDDHGYMKNGGYYNNYFAAKTPDGYVQYSVQMRLNYPSNYWHTSPPKLPTKELHVQPYYQLAVSDTGVVSVIYYGRQTNAIKPDYQILYALLESGSEFRVAGSILIQEKTNGEEITNE